MVGSALVAPRIFLELIFVFLRRSFWTGHIRNETRVPVRVVLLRECGEVQSSRTRWIVLMVRCRRTDPWILFSKMTACGLRVFLDFTDTTPTFSIEHEIGDLVSNDSTFR